MAYLPVKEPKPLFSIPLLRTCRRMWLCDRNYRQTLAVRWAGFRCQLFTGVVGKASHTASRDLEAHTRLKVSLLGRKATL